jgi:hypothetical protein
VTRETPPVRAFSRARECKDGGSAAASVRMLGEVVGIYRDLLRTLVTECR